MGAVGLIASLVLTACGGGGGGSSSGGGAPAPAPAPVPAGTVSFSGTVRYELVPTDTNNRRLNYAATVVKPIRGAVVELYSAASNQLLASAISDANGAYSVNVVNPDASVFLRVRAQLLQQAAPGWDFRVVDNTQAGAQYVLDTQAVAVNSTAVALDATAGSGWTGAAYGGARSAAPFAILDSIYGALQRVRSVDPTRAWPRLNLNWSVDNRPATGDRALGLITSSLYSGTDVNGVHNIYVLGKADVDTDEYDKHVITHEFGHYLQAVASRNDSIGGAHGAESLDMRVSFSEGWGDGWSAIATDDPLYIDTKGPAQASASVNPLSTAVTNNPGWYKSDSVAYLLWRFYQQPQIGFGTIWQAMTSATSLNTAALSNLHLFAVALKVAVPTAAGVIDSLMATQAATAADQWGSTETNNGGLADVLPLYKVYGALGSAQVLCVNIDASTPDPLNKLGNWAFTRLTVPASRTYSFALTGGADPNFAIYGINGFRRVANGTATSSETLTVALNAGEYVVAVTEYANANRTCMSLTIN